MLDMVYLHVLGCCINCYVYAACRGIKVTTDTGCSRSTSLCFFSHGIHSPPPFMQWISIRRTAIFGRLLPRLLLQDKVDVLNIFVPPYSRVHAFPSPGLVCIVDVGQTQPGFLKDVCEQLLLGTIELLDSLEIRHGGKQLLEKSRLRIYHQKSTIGLTTSCTTSTTIAVAWSYGLCLFGLLVEFSPATIRRVPD